MLAGCGSSNVVRIDSTGSSPDGVIEVEADLSPTITSGRSEGPQRVSMLQFATVGAGWSAAVVGNSVFTGAEMLSQISAATEIPETSRYLLLEVQYAYSGSQSVASTEDVRTYLVNDDYASVGERCGLTGGRFDRIVDVASGASAYVIECFIVDANKVATARFALQHAFVNDSGVLFSTDTSSPGAFSDPWQPGESFTVGSQTLTVDRAVVGEEDANGARLVAVSVMASDAASVKDLKFGAIDRNDVQAFIGECPPEAISPTAAKTLCFASFNVTDSFIGWAHDPDSDEIAFFAIQLGS